MSQQAFDQEIQGLDRVISSLEKGDRTVAEAAFLGPVHGFTHNTQPLVKDRDEARGKSLCEAVIEVENDLTTRAPDLRFAQNMRNLREEVRQSALVLGYTVDGQ